MLNKIFSILFVLSWHSCALFAQDNFTTSKVPKFNYSSDSLKQIEELKSDPLMIRFAKSREKMKDDPYRPFYHYVNPESTMHDANGLTFWKGKWHLFYQAFPPEDKRVHWGHAVSDDLVRWKDLPYAIYPNPEESVYSGSTLVENNRVIAMYHGYKLGNMVATSTDPLLLNWDKIATPAIPNKHKSGFVNPYYIFDPFIWKKGGVYYSITGGGRKNTGPAGKLERANYLFRSNDLINWQYMHEFIQNDKFTMIGEDAACPYFWPIGNQHILLFFSHMSGAQYMLGDYNQKEDKFYTSTHGKFNFKAYGPSGVHAPSATPDGKGGVIVIYNMNSGKPVNGWNELMTLPRRLTLLERDHLGIEPAGDIISLRKEKVIVPKQTIPANKEVVFKNVQGKAMEIIAEIDPKGSQMIEMNVFRSKDKREFTSIKFFSQRGYPLKRQNPKWSGFESLISMETANSSVLPDARSRAPEIAPIVLKEGEPLELRVFLDKSVVEVFVNGRQALAARVYPGLNDSDGISILSKGQDAELLGLTAWQMKDIYE